LLTDLQNKYDRLNKAIDEAWDVAQIKQYNAELQKNLQQQIVAQKAIIEAQKSVKGANDYGSEQWLAVKEAEEELQNLYDTQEELQKNIYSKLTGGIMDDVLSTTESFVDAWYDAFKETGDGLKGLEDNFNEMLLNLVKRQAAMKIAGRFVDEWNDALERYASEGGLSNSEIEYYANKVKNDLPALSSQLEAFFSSFDNVLGDASGNLSGLQKGISSITESQADILASYLNSIRFIVSDSNSQLKALLAAQTSTSASNPIVAQLQVIAQQASAINTLLNSLTAPYQNGGRAFKVVI
jgi:DNA repair exonuclease SbcCD ATPase subunit